MLSPDQTLISYVPVLIAHRLAANPGLIIEPKSNQLSAAILCVDIVGFPALIEQIINHGPAGSETLTAQFKSTFKELIDLLTTHGGDIVRFSGETLMILWPTKTTTETLETVLLRAIQCGLDTVDKFHGYHLTDNLSLSLRAAIGAGTISTTDLGGVYGRWEFLVTGQAILQTVSSKDAASFGQIILTPSVLSLVREKCIIETSTNSDATVKSLTDTIAPHAPRLPTLTTQAEAALRGYLPAALLSQVGGKQHRLQAELLPLTALFIKLPTVNDSMSLTEIQAIIRTLQTILYDHEASVDKISMDDQGTYLMAALGLPPLAHKEEGISLGVEAALAIKKELCHLGQAGTIGLATGRAFCGILGNEQRREYTILGNTINLARTLAEIAEQTSTETCPDVSIICDRATYQATRSDFTFDPLQFESITAYQPLTSLRLPDSEDDLDSDSWVDRDLLDEFGL